MPKQKASEFQTRQTMIEQDFELYRYSDRSLTNIAPHYHDHYEIYFFLKGKVEYLLENEIYPLQKGDIIIIPPNTLHHPFIKTDQSPYERIVLWISYNMWNQFTAIDPEINGCIKGENREPCFIRTSDSSWHGLYGKLLELIEDSKNKNICYKLNCHSIIANILVELNRIIHQDTMIITNPAQTLLTNLLQYIHTHIDSPLTLDDLSQKFLTSKYHIAHIFKDYIGVSFYQYVIQRRLIAATSRIIAGEPINKIYESCGFSDYSCFFRAFKKEYGVSPRLYKKTYGQKQ